MDGEIHEEKHAKMKRIRIGICAVAAVAVVIIIAVFMVTGRKYRVNLIDQSGNAVPGGTLQFQTGTSNRTVDADEDGTVTIPDDGKTYGIHVVSVPDGYLNDPSASYQVSSDEKEINITVKSINADVFRFQTTDIDGNAVSSEDFQDAKVILVNYWEPWCSPCISEMPDLSALYEKYKDKGLVILGVFSDTSEDAEAVASENAISYPMLHSNEELSKYATAYVPTSIFADGSGKILSQEEIIGAHSYDEWEQMILQYLEE